jgi:hypothetical protein
MMNEQLSIALATILEKALAAAQTGGQFLSEQLPDVIQQLLLFKAIESAVVCAIGLAICAAIAVAGYRLWKAGVAIPYNKYDNDGREGRMIIGCAMQIAAGVIASCILTHMTWLQIWLAPKVYLLEYAAQLVKPAAS